ncbi:MAG TPA: hypothetical protein VGX48_22995 [Pyrinomonadaceae bacterium]|nr:hypothetical protein [Pyrinomonadaceae bacterium]
MRHFLSLADVRAEDLVGLVERSLKIARGVGPRVKPLEGKVVGVYFRRSSTRTRTAFTVGALRHGAQVICYGPNDLQLVTGETVSDTGRVLAGYLDALVIRTNDTIEEMRGLADQREMAVVNAMSDDEHPTQAVADLVTIREALGRLEDVHVLYLGEGNNSAAALALAVARIPGMRLTVVTPEGYGLPDDVLARARRLADGSGAGVEQHHRVDQLPGNVDVVYTTRWQTMGVPKSDPDWREKFAPFGVTRALMARVSKPERAGRPGTVFMHDLPAVRGAEVTDEVLDGPQSLAFRQARHKMTSAMAVLEWCLAGA